jgi:hypothetical protein
MGTGTTLEAAIRMSRFAVGCDMDKECCDATASRLWATSEEIVNKSMLLYNILVQDNQIIEDIENIDNDENDDDQFPDNNCPDYVNLMTTSNCSANQILRFDCGRCYDLKLKNSTILPNEKGLFADCEIEESYLFIKIIDQVIAYYWGKFMTKENVISFFDERERTAHRLMKCNINKKYSFINGDRRCAGTYINDPNGSSNRPNVIFCESKIEDLDSLEYLISIKTLRHINIGEELFIEYGDLFFDNQSLLAQISNQNESTVTLI